MLGLSWKSLTPLAFFARGSDCSALALGNSALNAHTAQLFLSLLCFAWRLVDSTCSEIGVLSAQLMARTETEMERTDDTLARQIGFLS